MLMNLLLVSALHVGLCILLHLLSLILLALGLLGDLGEASEELMCMGRGEAEGKPSVGYLSYSISPSMLFTVLNCDVSSATLYFKLGQNRQLRGIKPGTYLKHDPLSSQHISVLNSSCFVSR